MSVRDYLGKKSIIGTPLAERLEEERVKPIEEAAKPGIATPYNYPQQRTQPPKPVWQDVAPIPHPGKTGMITETAGMKPIDTTQAFANNPQSPAISERVSKGENIYDVLLAMGRPVDYEAEEKKLKRERNSALIGDLAGVVGDSLGLALGARRFYPRQSNVARVDGKIERLQDFKRSDNINYWNQKLSAKYKDYEIDRAQRTQDAQLAYQKYKDDIQNGKWGAEMKLKVERINRDLANDKISQEQWGKTFAELQKQHSVVNSQGERRIAIADKNAEISKELKDAKLKGNNASKSNSTDSITVKGSDGKPKRVDYPKHMNAALTSYLYGRMKEITESDSQNKRTIEDTAMKFGEGGDHAGKMSAIVKRRISEFPELIPEMEQIIRDNSTEKPSGSLLPGGGSGSLLPK